MTATHTDPSADARPYDEWARLSALTAYGVLERPAPLELHDLVQVAALVCGTAAASVNIIDATEQRPIASAGVSVACAREDSFCHVAIMDDAPLVVPDAMLDLRFVDNPQVDGRLARIRRYAAALLRTPTGLALGTLCVYDEEPGEFSEQQLAALAALGRQAMEAINQRRRADELDRTVLELARAHEHLAAFAGQISHDLKTPLTATLGFTQLALDTVVGDPTTTAFLERAEASGHRMLTMIDDILGYARIGGALRRVRVDLDDVVGEIAQDLHPMIDAAGGAQIVTDGSTIVADRAQVRTLLQNLVANAVRYRHPDRPPLVRVGSATLPDGWVVRVEDNGMGIPAEHRVDVLQPLTRLHHDLPGTGLGLATCERIAHAHGGVLRLDETAGGGTTVRVTLLDPDRADA